MRRIALALWLVLIGSSAPADDLCDCRADCTARADPAASRTYDDEEHRLWYEARFWAGKCKGEIWLTCWSGPSWYDVMAEVMSQGTAADRPEMCRRLHRIGVRMGYEWARDNAVRVIHTADLEEWKSTLLGSDDPMQAIGKIEDLVASRLE